MSNSLQNELEQIAKMRRIKDYKNMSKEELLIALLKSEQRRAELYKRKSNNSEIEEARKTFNEIRNKLLKLEIKEIRRNLYEKEKGLENKEEQERRQHGEELEALKTFLEGLQKEIKKKTITNQEKLRVLSRMITWNMKAEETNIKTYHLKVILI